MSLTDRLAALRPLAAAGCRLQTAPYPTATLFFSISDGARRATVVHACGPDFDSAWNDGVDRLLDAARRRKLDGRWLRVDWVEAVESSSVEAFEERLATIKRNYFRHGLALDADFAQAYTEQELNANAMLYGGTTIAHAVINRNNFARYARTRFGLAAEPVFNAHDTVYVLSTAGAFHADGEPPRVLGPSGRDGGRRALALDQAEVRALVERSAAYLARQVQPTGAFDYGCFPCFDRPIATYNTLRHASSAYALIEAWELVRDAATDPAQDPIGLAIERALGYLTEHLVRHYTLPDGRTAAFLVDSGEEIKLGGNAVCLLALVKYSEVTGSHHHLPLLEQLASGIAWMQDPASGRFDHVLRADSLALKEAFRIIYYDGEAAFGLMRLYGLTGDARWLAVVEKAFEHFIAAEHWKAHDHWLSYCVNELTRYKPEARYFRFGLRNVSDHLDFVLERETTFPTLLELMLAAERMIARLAREPGLRPLLREIDLDKFYRALDHRAHHLLNGHFWPELAMYFRNPARIVDSFFIRHHSFRVRIDDVEHYLSGFVAYHAFLGRGRVRLPPPPAPAPGAAVEPYWSAAEVLEATGGQWLRPPASRHWRATGLCIWLPTLRAGQMVALRPAGGKGGVPPAALGQAAFLPQAVITADDDVTVAAPIPVLKVADLNRAILDLGHYARSRLHARIVGVTGSAGKTTVVAMLANALRPWGEVGLSSHNANLPHGIAWNLASTRRDLRHIVMEMAIGRMQQNAALVRPHLAVVTNIAAAHLEHHGTTAEVARRKSRIFSAMPEGGVAVINRDMDEWSIVHEAARARGLRIIHYGRHSDSEVRLLDYDGTRGEVLAQIAGTTHRYRIGAPGEHMAMNGLACAACALALDLPVEPVLLQLASFRAVEGRGAQHLLELGGRSLRLIDEAYNANPASMAAAIRLAAELPPARPDGRRILVLGDMLELGPDSADLHRALLPEISAASPAQLLLCGTQMRALFEEIDGRLPACWFETPAALNAVLPGLLADGDLVLVKSSGGTGLSETVALLRRLAGPVPPA